MGIKSLKRGVSVFEVEARDKCFKMTLGRKNQYFHEMKDSDAFEEILGEYDMQTDIESSDYENPRLVQYYSTDWDFMLTRSEVNGKMVFADDNHLSIKSPDFDQEETLELTYGANILEMEAGIDSRTQLPAVETTSWNPADQEKSEIEAADPGIEEAGNLSSSTLAEVGGMNGLKLSHSGQLADEEMQSWADHKAVVSRLAKVRGRVSFQGYADLKPGNMIKLNGLGERFNGKVFVSAVRHEIGQGNWLTHAEFGLDPKPFSKKPGIVDTKASGLIPGVNGLHIGIVTSNEDPDGEYRVRIKVPQINMDDEGIWARIASLDAGNSRGFFFRPEIGDEVIVGFLNDDPRNPVILGMLHSSALPAPFEPSDDNHEKGYVSRDEMKLVFNDDDKSISIETPNGNTVLLSEDEGAIIITDENSNKIEMNSDGITMESPGDINIKATGDANIEGMNVNIKATANLKAEGSAGAELSSGASTTVKGAIVQIN